MSFHTNVERVFKSYWTKFHHQPGRVAPEIPTGGNGEVVMCDTRGVHGF